MQIQIERVNNVTIVAVEGEINIDSVKDLQGAFAEILKEGTGKVVVDFEKVAFIDSSGLAALIDMVRQLKRINGKMSLCCVNEAIREVFEITKIHKFIPIHGNRQTAVRNT